jgi:threonine/homoserine/homoserine lactone efflux protein
MAILHGRVMVTIIKGVELGLLLAILVGPIFFTLLQTSLERGFSKGVLVAIGVSLSDILYVTICYFGLAQWMTNPTRQTYMALVGGLMLMGFGYHHLVIKTRSVPLDNPNPFNERSMYRYVLKGFLINGMTPTVLLFWIATVSIATLDFGYSKAGEFVLFFGALLGTVLLTDILKAYLAGRLRQLVTERSMRIMNIILGSALILFGGRLLWLAKNGLFP